MLDQSQDSSRRASTRLSTVRASSRSSVVGPPRATSPSSSRPSAAASRACALGKGAELRDDPRPGIVVRRLEGVERVDDEVGPVGADLRDAGGFEENEAPVTVQHEGVGAKVGHH